jgi:hypothetical protein
LEATPDAQPKSSVAPITRMSMNPSDAEQVTEALADGGTLYTLRRPVSHGTQPCSHHAFNSAELAVGMQPSTAGWPIATGHKGPSQPMIGKSNLHAAERR